MAQKSAFPLAQSRVGAEERGALPYTLKDGLFLVAFGSALFLLLTLWALGVTLGFVSRWFMH